MGRFVDQFFVQITGPADPSAPALVFLHGVMGYALNWRRVAKAFESEYRVLAYDSRGHGRSVHGDLAAQPDLYSPESLAEDLRLILDDLGWQKVAVIGHSMGGRVAYTFAARYPERVVGAVIEDIGPNMSPVGTSTVARVLSTVPVPFADKKAARAWFSSEFPKHFADLRNAAALAEWLYANITESESGQAVWRFHVDGVRAAVEAGHTQERWDEIRALKCPTLVVRGEHSTDLPHDVLAKMLATNPLIRGVEIPGAGHWVHSDQLEPFIAALRPFLASLSF